MKIAVIGAGNVGAALAAALDRAGHQLFLGVRDPLSAKIKTIVQQHPRITAFEINDAVAQADVIILAVPADAVIDVVRQFGDVQEKIIIDATNSLFFAPKPYKNAAEAMTALTNVKHFAKCFNSTGYENMLNPGYGETAADMFVAGDSVAAKDISAFALKRLTALDFRGVNVQYLLGARDVTYRETAQIIGNAIGKSDLTYMEFPFAEYKKGFMQMGATESLADNINEFVQAMNHGRVSEDYTRNAENTTPTTLEGFAQAFAYVYHHA